MGVFTIDGQAFDVAVVELKRNFNVIDNENTGRALNGVMDRDIVGSYVGYSVSIERRNVSPADYDRLFELISAPKEFHDFIMPYGQTVYDFKAYVTNGSDVLERMSADGNLWSGLSFNIVAKVPRRRP